MAIFDDPRRELDRLQEELLEEEADLEAEFDEEYDDDFDEEYDEAYEEEETEAAPRPRGNRGLVLLALAVIGLIAACWLRVIL